MPKLIYSEPNTQIRESKKFTEGELESTTIDTTIATYMNSLGTRKRLIIRNHINKNEFGNIRTNSYFMVFEEHIKKGVTAYLDQALDIYNKL